MNRKQVVGKEEAKRLDKMITMLDKQIDSIEEKIREIIRSKRLCFVPWCCSSHEDIRHYCEVEAKATQALRSDSES